MENGLRLKGTTGCGRAQGQTCLLPCGWDGEARGQYQRTCSEEASEMLNLKLECQSMGRPRVKVWNQNRTESKTKDPEEPGWMGWVSLKDFFFCDYEVCVFN